jgi:hypothetical protein
MKIYLISAYLNGETLYKIGITHRDVEKRLKELKTGNAAELKIVEVFESKWATKIEINFHVSLASKNIGGGEWFVLTNDDVDNFICKCKMLHENFELLFKTNSWFSDIMSKQ